MLLADRAYLSEPFKQQLLEQQSTGCLTAGLELSMPTKCGESTHLSRQELCKRKWLRRLIETVGNQLCHDFHIKKVWACDIRRLTNRICHKILAHVICVMYRLKEGLKTL